MIYYYFLFFSRRMKDYMLIIEHFFYMCMLFDEIRNRGLIAGYLPVRILPLY